METLLNHDRKSGVARKGRYKILSAQRGFSKEERDNGASVGDKNVAGLALASWLLGLGRIQCGMGVKAMTNEAERDAFEKWFIDWMIKHRRSVSVEVRPIAWLSWQARAGLSGCEHCQCSCENCGPCGNDLDSEVGNG